MARRKSDPVLIPEGSPLAGAEVVHLFWLQGMGCDGCTSATLSATTPSIEQLLWGAIPGVPTMILHHQMLSDSSGEEFIEPFRQAAAGTLGAPYVLVLDGSVPDDQAFPSPSGYFSALGAGEFESGSGDRPTRMTDWLWRLAPGALACFAPGTCASFGGIPAAAGNITGSMSLMDFLGRDYRSSAGIPVINVPGCPPLPDNFTEALLSVLYHLAGTGPRPDFDELGRPHWQFSEPVHRHCPKAGYYEEGVFAEMPGDNQCLVEIGCWGPVVQCNIVERGAIGHLGGCMVAGGACIGCTMPGFPDKHSPFYKAPPGSAISGGMSKVYGGAIRRMRRMSMKTGNREPLWDTADEVPSGWARGVGSRSGMDKMTGYFYKKLQY
ncbi:MAG: hydrogenase expression protein HypE, partial [Actinomycetota bacterium]|nr:hydrogenase expression protein HypE [Actinomycetota bacterium]